MSVPRRNFKKLSTFFRQKSIRKTPVSSTKEVRKKKDRRQSSFKRRKGEEKPKPLRARGDRDKLKKSKYNFLRDNSTTGEDHSNISSDDHAAAVVGIKHPFNPPSSTPHSNSPKAGHASKSHTQHVAKGTRGKRKSVRRAKNANESPATTLSPLAGVGVFGLIGNVFLNQDEEEVLRRKILDKVDVLDPLHCLPKLMCGFSSRRRQKKFPQTTTTTTTTHRPKVNEDVIDEYLHLLGIITPIPKEQHEVNLKEAITYLNWEAQSSKENKKKATVGKKKPDTVKKGSVQQDLDQDQDQSGSSSGSTESDESAQREGHSRYPLRRPPPPYYAQHPHPYYSRRPYYGGHPYSRPSREKFLFNRNKDKDTEENDLEEDDSEVEPEDDEVDDLLDDEDVKYIVEREQMKKLMSQTGTYSDENWWQPFDDDKLQNMAYYYPPPDPSYNPLASDDILSTDGGGLTGWFSNMFTNFMPRISWAGESKKDPDSFKNDPFFTSFDGRSLSNREGRNLFGESNSKLPASSTTLLPPKIPKKGKQLNLGQSRLESTDNSRQLDYNLSEDRVDPAAKYRIAVEIGSRVASPSQCDFIYNGCPLTYEEILAIINEPVRQKPIRTRTKPYTTSTTASIPTTSTYTTTLPTTTKGNKSFAHNFITPPAPQQIVLPLHHQQSPYHHQPSKTVFLQQPHRQQSYFQYHSVQPQHSLEQVHTYSREYQQQLAQLPHILYGQHLRRPPQPTLIPNIEDIMAQVAQSVEKPQKTKIHQALPNGEVEINVHYRPSLESSEKRRKPLPGGNLPPFSQNLKFAPDVLADDTLLHPYSGATSLSSSYEHSLLSDPFNREAQTYPSYEFYPSNGGGYKIRRKKGEMEKSGLNKEVEETVSSNTIKPGGSSSGFSLSTSEESNNNTEDVSPPAQEKSKRKVSPSSLVAHQIKGKDAYKRRQMLKNASSSSAPAPMRHPTSFHHKTPQKQKQQRKPASKEMAEKGKKKKSNGNNNNGKRKIQNDDNSGGNSSGNKSSAAATSSSSEVDYNKGEGKKKKHRNHKQKTRRKGPSKKWRRKPHLHEHSSEGIQVKKRRKIASSNAIYPIYGHPFPPPYAGYYHTTTSTSPSIFSYFFGR